jgi:hypothetical protein
MDSHGSKEKKVVEEEEEEDWPWGRLRVPCGKLGNGTWPI